MGDGVPFARETVSKSGLRVLPEKTFRPRAEIVYSLGVARASEGAFDDASLLTPIYIRRPEAEEVWERRQGSNT